MNNLNLGVARGIITPELGCMLYGYPSKPIADKIHDDLTVTAFYFVYGKIKSLLVSATVCVVRSDIDKKLRNELSEKFNIPMENIVIAATHTHTAPAVAGMHSMWGGFNEEYFETIFKPTLISTIEEAMGNAEPVLVASVNGNSDIGVNRRVLNLENQIDFGECRWGAYDRKMTVISFKGEAGIKANLIWYGAHGTSMGASTEVSRDWSGVMTDMVEEKTGAITAFLLGAEGDVAPRKIYPGQKGSPAQMEGLGKIAGEDALRIFDTLPEYKEVSFDVFSGKVKLPLNPRDSLEYAKNQLEEFSKQEKITVNNSVGKEHCEEVIESYDKGYVEVDFREIDQYIIKIGDDVVVANAFELFSEITMRIDDAFPNHNILNLSCANGQEGYFPTASQVVNGGYEVLLFANRGVQTYVSDADFHFIKGTVENIEKII